ncbi:MAG TPA: septal ring lytic transglycosylase RlpA family lipoprotein, partial [Methylomirabilota bacterium]|nr:septal ring lytic transglycosylase RlpA family lipoprotein [Methylomirabilota bacterium]
MRANAPRPTRGAARAGRFKDDAHVAALTGAILALAVAACTTAPKTLPAPAVAAPSAPSASSGGRYYKDDGPGEHPPDNLDAMPDAVPRL